MENSKKHIKETVITILSLIAIVLNTMVVALPFARESLFGKVNYSKIIENIINAFNRIEFSSNDSFVYKMYVFVGLSVSVIAIVLGVIFSIILLTKLVRRKCSGREIAYVKVILSISVLYTAFYNLYADKVIPTMFLSNGNKDIYLSFIVCISVMLIALIMQLISKLIIEKENIKKYLINDVLSIISFVVASIIFIAISIELVAIHFGFININMSFSVELSRLASIFGTVDNEYVYKEGTVWVIIMVISIVIITILASCTMKKCFNAITKNKYNNMPEIILGICSVGFYIVYVIACNMYLAGFCKDFIYDTYKVRIYSGGYVYIICGVISIVVGLIGKLINNKSNRDVMLEA